MTDSDNQVVRVLASVQLVASDQGGRQSPIAHKYMPRAKFAETEGYTAFMLGTGVEMMPGTSRLVELAAIGSSKFVSNVQIGAQFSIHEGPAQVGQGTVYSIIAGPADRFVG